MIIVGLINHAKEREWLTEISGLEEDSDRKGGTIPESPSSSPPDLPSAVWCSCRLVPRAETHARGLKSKRPPLVVTTRRHPATCLLDSVSSSSSRLQRPAAAECCRKLLVWKVYSGLLRLSSHRVGEGLAEARAWQWCDTRLASGSSSHLDSLLQELAWIQGTELELLWWVSVSFLLCSTP